MISSSAEVYIPVDNQSCSRDLILTSETGGTAGLVLGNRLSESGTNRVLVLEDGQAPEVVAAYAAPGGNQFLAGNESYRHGRLG